MVSSCSSHLLKNVEDKDDDGFPREVIRWLLLLSYLLSMPCLLEQRELIRKAGDLLVYLTGQNGPKSTVLERVRFIA